MDYNIIRVVTEPDEYGMHRVEYRTADGKDHALHYTPGSRAPEDIVQSWLADEARREAAPPRSFAMVVKMDVSDKSFAELQQEYRDFCKSKGYEVDANMQPYKPAPARAPRQTA